MKNHAKSLTGMSLLVLLILSLCGSAFAADTDFRIEINDLLTDNSEKQGDKVNIAVTVKNLGEEGTQYIECGIYTKDQVESWGYSTNAFMAIFDFWRNIDNVENCKSGETNVDTVKATLKTGEEIGLDALYFFPRAPYTDPNDEYVIFCDAYKACYGSPGFELIDNRVTSVDITSFDLEPSGDGVSATCADGILNQDETDTDCGGKCDECPKYYHCDADSDCETDYCDDGVCLDRPATGSNQDDGNDEYEPNPDNGGAWDITWGDVIKEYWIYMAAGLFLLVGLIVLIVAVAGTMRGG